MGKKVYITIISLITIGCIIAGLMINVKPFGKGIIFSFKPSSEDNYDNVESDSVTDAFSKIDVSISMGNVEIMTGDEYKVYYKAPDFLKIKVTNNNGVLTVKDSTSGFGFKNLNFDICKVEIVVPELAKLDSVVVDCDMGNVTLDKIKVKNLEADVDMGNFEAYDSDIKLATVDCDMGNIGIEGTADVISADCDMGNIDVEISNFDDAKMDLDADMGNIDVNGKSQGNEYHK